MNSSHVLLYYIFLLFVFTGSNTDFYNGLLVAWFMFMYNTYPENHKVIWLVSNGGHTAGPDPVPLATNIKQLGELYYISIYLILLYMYTQVIKKLKRHQIFNI